MKRQIIHTDKAPAAIGTYSQAVQVAETIYLSGQAPWFLDVMEFDPINKWFQQPVPPENKYLWLLVLCQYE